MKNICVAAISAIHNGGCKVAIVTNIEIPNPYNDILLHNNVDIIFETFDLYRFEDNLVWYLAFYKLCAFYKICHEYEYDNIACVDADVFVQSSLDNIFQECQHNILLYDINNSLLVNDYTQLIDECTPYFGERKLITHYGGEFIAARKNMAILFSECCLDIFHKMNSNNITTTKGDEFIISIAGYYFKTNIKNCGGYVYRYWTDPNFRLVSTNYKINNGVAILHMPSEKSQGLIKIYQKIKKDQFPLNKYVWRKCALTKPRTIQSVKYKIRTLIFNKKHTTTLD